MQNHKYELIVDINRGLVNKSKRMIFKENSEGYIKIKLVKDNIPLSCDGFEVNLKFCPPGGKIIVKKIIPTNDELIYKISKEDTAFAGNILVAAIIEKYKKTVNAFQFEYFVNQIEDKEKQNNNGNANNDIPNNDAPINIKTTKSTNKNLNSEKIKNSKKSTTTMADTKTDASNEDSRLLFINNIELKAGNNIISLDDIPDGSKRKLFSGHYKDLTGKPAIPTKLSQLQNDCGYTTYGYDDSIIWEALEKLSEKTNEITAPQILPYNGNFECGKCYYADFTSNVSITYPDAAANTLNQFYLEFTIKDSVAIDWGTECLFLNGQIPTLESGFYYRAFFEFSTLAQKWTVGVIKVGAGS